MPQLDYLDEILRHQASLGPRDPDAELRALLGVESPQLQPEEPLRPQGRLGRILGAFGGLEHQVSQYRPQTAGSAFALGLLGSLGSAGSRVAAERAKFEEASAERTRARNQANLEATREFNRRRFEAARDLSKEGRAESRVQAAEQRREERSTRLVMPQDVADRPEFGQFEGERVPLEWFKPKDPGSVAREQRAIEAANRQADAAERANRLEMVRSINTLVNEYRMDDAIQGYTRTRSNLVTAREAEKQQSGLGDVALVYAFMRTREPENPNVVREGEAQNIQNAVGQLARYKSILKRFIRGDRFTNEGRRAVVKMIEADFKAKRPLFDLANDQFRRRAEAFGQDPSLFMREFPEDFPAEGSFSPGGWFDQNRPGK